MTMIGRDVALQVSWMTEELTDLCVSRSLEVPVSVAPGNKTITGSRGICSIGSPDLLIQI